jgi:peptidoglycan glycosyltransferase
VKKVQFRSFIVLIISGVLIFGLIIYLCRYISQGDSWVSFPVNKHMYTNGVLTSGEIYDVNGVRLAGMDGDKRVYAEKKAVRVATLHAVGDKSGNISTAAQTKFSYLLTDYSLINGAYSLTGRGNSLYLTLDSSLCVTAYDALDGRNGTVALYNYKTGDILCMVSTPSFDPANPPKIGDGSGKYVGVYMNRFLSTAYTPGSVFKLVTSAAAIENIDNLGEWKFKCTGKYTIDGKVITCTEKHGTQDIYASLANSCNGAFAKLSQELGAAAISKYAKRAGLTQPLSFNGIDCASGSIRTDASSADLAWAAIGQDKDLVNPAAMLTFVGGIANGGVAVKPNLIAEVRTPLGLPMLRRFRSDGDRMFKKSTADELAKMMRNNVEENYGEERFKGMKLCAKSGTAELDDGTDHAWFVGFSQREDFPVAFVVVVEHGGSGNSVAGGIAGTVLTKAMGEL